MNTAIESEKNTPAPEVPQPKTKRTKKAKPHGTKGEEDRVVEERRERVDVSYFTSTRTA